MTKYLTTATEGRDVSSWFIAVESFSPLQGSQAWQSSLIHGRSSISDSCWCPAAPKRRERHEPGGIDIKNLSTVTDLHHIISFSLKPCHQLENKYYKHESMEHIQVQSVAFCAWPPHSLNTSKPHKTKFSFLVQSLESSYTSNTAPKSRDSSIILTMRSCEMRKTITYFKL